MHSQVAHAAVFAVVFDLSLPVDRFFRIQIAGVEKTGFHLDDSSKGPILYHFPDPLHGWEKGKFGSTADEDIGIFIDSLQNGQLIQDGAELQLTDTVDRVYTQPEPVIEVTDPKHNRVITIKNSGANSAVIWNPWAEGAESMGDMADNGYETMLCVESTWHAKSLEEGKALPPGESHQLVTEIAVK